MHVDKLGKDVLVLLRQTEEGVGRTVLDILRQGGGNLTGSVEVVVNDTVGRATGIDGSIAPLRGHRLELAVDHEVVEDRGEGILFQIDGTTLYAVTTPTGIDDGVVVRTNECLVTACFVVLT